MRNGWARWGIPMVAWALFVSCSDDATAPGAPKTLVDIRILKVTCGSWGGYHCTEDTTMYTVGRSDEFCCCSFGGRPLFKVLRIVSPEEAEIVFDRSLVVEGEPISRPSAYSSVIVTPQGICLRTRTYDVSWTYCLSVVPPQAGER